MRFFALPKADRSIYAGDLGDTAWETQTGMNAWGDQATFDIFPDGQTDQGLRVTIERGTNRQADGSNDFAVTFVSGTANVDLTSADKTIEITIPDGSALSVFKTNIDNVGGLNSEYFGGETGTSTVADVGGLPDTVSAGGTRDRGATFRVAANDAILIFAGTATPTDNAVSVMVPNDETRLGRLEAGEQLYFRRRGTADVPGSCEIWMDEIA